MASYWLLDDLTVISRCSRWDQNSPPPYSGLFGLYGCLRGCSPPFWPLGTLLATQPRAPPRSVGWWGPRLFEIKCFQCSAHKSNAEIQNGWGTRPPPRCVAHVLGESSSLVGLPVTNTSSWLISSVLADNGNNEATASMGGDGAARNITTTQRLNGHSTPS